MLLITTPTFVLLGLQIVTAQLLVTLGRALSIVVLFYHNFEIFLYKVHHLQFIIFE